MGTDSVLGNRKISLWTSDAHASQASLSWPLKKKTGLLGCPTLTIHLDSMVSNLGLTKVTPKTKPDRKGTA